MVKTLTALTAAGAVAAAAMVSVPDKAEAFPVWVVPAIVGGVVGGVVLGSAVAANANYSYGPGYAPRGTVYVQPRSAASCHIVRERTANGWRRVEVCN
jgi:hypothetical protein